MPRRARSIEGGLVYHILNRPNARMTMFEKDEDYAAFERVLEEAHEREPLRVLAYCVREGYGGHRLIDLSASENHGRITGAQWTTLQMRSPQ